MTRSMLLSLMIALAIGCKPDVNVWIYEAPDSDEPATPASDDDDSTEPLADDDDSAVAQEDCGLYLPEDPWTVPACFAPDGVIPQVETLTDGMWVQAEIGDSIVMYYITDGRRWPVPTLQRFMSWKGEDACVACAGVANVTPDLAQTLELGGNVTARPGTIIAIKADSSLYVIDQCRTARPILPSIAQEIYGEGWEQHLLQFPYKPEVFFVDHFMGSPVESMEDFDLASALARTIDEEVLGIGCQSESVEGDIVMEIRAAAGQAPQTVTRGTWTAALFTFEVETFDQGVSIPWFRPQLPGDSTPISDGIDQGVSASDRFGGCVINDGEVAISDYVAPQTIMSIDLELTVPALSIVQITVACSVDNTPTADGDPDEFAVILPSAGDIEVELLESGDLVPSSQIRVGPDGLGINLDFAIWTQIVDQGELYLSPSPGSPVGTITAGTENLVAAWRAAADYEGYLLQELSVSFTGDVQYLGNVKLYWVDPYGFVFEHDSFVVPEGWANFAGIADLSAPRALWQDILLFAEVSPEAPSGAEIQAHLNAWNLGFWAVGLFSGTVLTEAEVATTVPANVLTVN